MKRVAIGSQNPVKIEATKQAFEAIWPDEEWEVVFAGVGSGVSDQPMSDDETIDGAVNRARRVREIFDADFGVGIEAGIHQIEEDCYASTWVAIEDRDGKMGIGSSTRVPLPGSFLDIMREGKELGEATDSMFNRENSKQEEGFVGIMTNGVVTRTHAYIDAVACALAPFIHDDLF
ncbi:MAG: inosine/xanthosine triphosphatase [bacterium]|nr:inosine/xanthosine triphosphatase [bacterium]